MFVAVLRTIPWDKICAGKCHTVIVDTTVRPEFARDPKVAQLTEQMMKRLSTTHRSFVPGRYENTKPGKDSAIAVVTLTTSASDGALEFVLG